MRNKILFCLALLLPEIGSAQPADAYLYVSAIQPPVWVLHKDERSALGASSPVSNGDTIITGPGAHVHLALADGSLLKLGENASLGVQNLQLQTGKQVDTLNGTLKISAGSLRYTSQKQRASFKTELTLQVGRSFSAQTSSADLWVDAGASEDRLLLTEGSVIVTPSKKPAVTMAQANTMYTAYRNSTAGADGISQIQEPRLLLMLTELDTRHPALQSNGPYRIALANYPDEAKAAERVRKYVALGYPVELQRPGKPFPPGYRVILDGLSSSEHAKAYAELLIQRLKLLNPQVESLAQ